MSIIKVAGKKFTLASRWARLGAFLLDIGFLGVCQALLGLLGVPLFEIFDYFSSGHEASNMTSASIGTLSCILWGFGLFFMDGLKKGGGFGKKLLSLQIIRLEDGEPANFKDGFVRRFAGIFQPVDWLFATGKEKQRMGDKLAKTVVVKLDTKPVEFVAEGETESAVKTGVQTTDLEKVLGDVIHEITNRFSEAKQKVDASVGVEQNATEAAALARAASEVDVEFKDVKLHREFSNYAEDASIDKDLAELKAKSQ